jgi:glycosyltransferase involved in cell wall biosynthesis
MSLPLVSVAVATYGHEDYIGRCLQGILRQRTSFPFEVVVGTDCSPDGTDAIVRDYACRFPDVVRGLFRDRNIGAHANHRDILRSARGKYLAICDGDDEWTDPCKLQKQVDVLEADPRIVLVFTDIDQFYPASGTRVCGLQKRLNARLSQMRSVDWFEAVLLRKVAVHTATVCARTDAWTAAEADVTDILNVSPMGDTPTLLALSRYGDFAYLPDSTALMNRLPESSSRSRSHSKKAEFQLGSIRMALAVADKYGYSSPEFEAALAQRVLMVLRLCILGRSPHLAESVVEQLSQRVPLQLQHRVLARIARMPGAAGVYAGLDASAIRLRRRWRRYRYGVESSV